MKGARLLGVDVVKGGGADAGPPPPRPGFKSGIIFRSMESFYLKLTLIKGTVSLAKITLQFLQFFSEFFSLILNVVIFLLNFGKKEPYRYVSWPQ